MDSEHNQNRSGRSTSDPKNIAAGKGISRRKFLKNAGMSMGAAMMGPGLRPFGTSRFNAPDATDQPNILIIFDDQLRRDVLGVCGGGWNITTPHIDRLSGEGTTFRNSISPCPLCTPYRGMLMTGRYPTHSGIIMNFVQASPEQNPHCLANVFDKAGYNTGFIGKWHLASGFRVGEGLHVEDFQKQKEYRQNHPNSEFVPPGAERLGFEHWQAYNFHGDFRNYWYYEDKPKKIYSHKYETDTEFDQAISYIEQHKNSEKPFLLTVAPHPPHPSFQNYPRGYLEKVVPPDQIKRDPNVPRNNPRTIEQLRGYYAMAKNVDDNVGRLMDYLDESGVAENTIVIFTADHGEMHGSHGRVNKMVPYREAVNIPLIMRWPGHIPEGRFIDALHTPMDTLPTLCGLTGIDIPDEVDGKDMSEVVKGNRYPARDAVMMMNYTSHWDFFQTGTLWPEWRGVFTGRHTYVKWLTGEEELYDNAIDPYQMDNRVEDQDHFTVLQNLRRRLKQFLRDADDDFRPGDEYAAWYDKQRNLLKTGLGPVPSFR